MFTAQVPAAGVAATLCGSVGARECKQVVRDRQEGRNLFLHFSSFPSPSSGNWAVRQRAHPKQNWTHTTRSRFTVQPTPKPTSNKQFNVSHRGVAENFRSLRCDSVRLRLAGGRGRRFKRQVKRTTISSSWSASPLKIKAKRSSETSVTARPTTLRYNSEDHRPLHFGTATVVCDEQRI